MTAAASISVLLVEDHSLLRLGIKASLADDPSIFVIGEAENGFEAVQKAALLHPDVIVMDVAMPVMDGLESSRIIRQQNTNSKIIFLSSHQDQETITSAIHSGARGFCRKDIETNQLCDVIRAVHNGEIWLDSVLSNADLLKSPARAGFTQLTPADLPLPAMLEQFSTVFSSETQQTNNAVSDSYNPIKQCLNDKYEYLGFLGSGGMSVVHKVRHRLLDKVFAMKLLGASQIFSDSSSKRFTLEAQVTSQLSHANIIGIHDYGFASDGRPYLVMDLADGPTISEVLTQRGRIPENEARRIFKQIVEGLSHAHSRGVIHRDIKPGNIILTTDENGMEKARIVDFGLAKVTARDKPLQQLTQTDQVIGSPLYMSPEQCHARELDHRSDIYSFGCLMYEVICGKPPFYGSSAFDTMHMHVHDEPEEPAASLCSPILSQIIYKCLRKNPNDRFVSAKELLMALQQ